MLFFQLALLRIVLGQSAMFATVGGVAVGGVAVVGVTLCGVTLCGVAVDGLVVGVVADGA